MSSREKIFCFIKDQMHYINELGKDLMKVIYINNISNNSNHSLMDQDRSLYKILESFIKEGLESGEFKSILSIQEISMLISRCIRGVVYDWCSDGDDFDLVKEGDKLIVFILDGIKEKNYK